MKSKKIQRATIHNMDCMEYMKGCEDNQFDLAICDPPYGVGMHGGSRQYNTYTDKAWDNEIPKKEYFNELLRVSKNQIIWGGNYFTEFLYPSRCFLIWDKTFRGNTFADGELAWCSMDSNARIHSLNICHNQGKRFHPTQKPVKLYEWLLTNYAKQGNTILDTHMGSGSIAIATNKLGFDLTACELDKDYYKAACKRIENESRQVDMFTPEPDLQEQDTLF